MPRHEAPLEDPTKEDKVHSKVLALQQEQRIIWLQEENRKLSQKLEFKDKLLDLLQRELNQELECPECEKDFGIANVPYTFIGCGHTICMVCMIGVFEAEDGAAPHPYNCPLCGDSVCAPPRRDTKTELLVCWLQLAEGEPIDTPERMPSDAFDEYFEEGGYVSEEV